MELRWVIPRCKKYSRHEYIGEKWENTWVYHSKRILQYSLDGCTWKDVECFYKDIPESEMHLYNWDKQVVNNKLINLNKS